MCALTAGTKKMIMLDHLEGMRVRHRRNATLEGTHAYRDGKRDICSGKKECHVRRFA